MLCYILFTQVVVNFLIPFCASPAHIRPVQWLSSLSTELYHFFPIGHYEWYSNKAQQANDASVKHMKHTKHMKHI